MTDRYDDPDRRPDELRQLGEGPMPPEPLEDRTVRALAARGVLARRLPRRTWLKWIGPIAAGVGGYFVGRGGPAEAPDGGASRWMLLLFEDADFEGPAPGREADYVAEYGRWAAKLRAEGRVVDGAPLGEREEVVAPAGLEAGSAGTPIGRLAGYFTVTAADAAEARRIAETCPHLRHRGRIAIRPVIGTS